jgi:hypothetical protein
VIRLNRCSQGTGAPDDPIGLVRSLDCENTTLLPAIQNAQVKDLVTKVAPAFVVHRDRAQALLKE